MDVSSEIEDVARAYDHFSLEQVPSFPATWARLREECPVAHSDQHGGFHVLTRYEDVWATANDWKTFTSSQRVAIPPNEFPPALPIEVDPPLHREYRRALNGPLAPQVVSRYEPAMRELATTLLGAMDERDEVDFNDAYADPFVKRTVLDAVGLPAADRDMLTDLVEKISTQRDAVDQVQLSMQLFGYLLERTAERRTGPPRDDVFGALLQAEVQGRPITDEEVVGNMITTIFGGIHTTTVFLNSLVHWMVQNPDRWQRLRDEPDLLVTGIEELLRIFASGAIGRTATRDTEIRGCPIRAGERVMIVWGSANLDPDEFDRPDEVVFDRPKNRHMAFGIGPHRCVGSHLAKLMIKVSVTELLPVVGRWELDPAREVQWSGGESRGIHRLPLRKRG